MLFSNPNQDLKLVKAKQLKVVLFYYNKGLLKTITNVSSPCDCSSVENDVVNSRIIVRYTPKKISKHLELEGHSSYSTKKTFIVSYTDSSGLEKEEVLSFTAVVQS